MHRRQQPDHKQERQLNRAFDRREDIEDIQQTEMIQDQVHGEDDHEDRNDLYRPLIAFLFAVAERGDLFDQRFSADGAVAGHPDLRSFIACFAGADAVY